MTNEIVGTAKGGSSRHRALRLVVIISDGIRGHVNQSRGVARRLAAGTGADIVELETPELRGAARARAKKDARAALRDGSRRSSRDWLAAHDGEGLVRALGTALIPYGIREGDSSKLVLISAGTMAALYNIALGYIWRCTCVTIMTPSVVGTEPFDFAIVPEHDHPRDLSGVLVTVGAPNLIDRDEIASLGEELLRRCPSKSPNRWAILIGGDDANYRISGEWIRTNVLKLIREAEREEADLYITTSRRTSAEAENALARIATNSDRVRYIQLASQDESNCVPALLGACGEVFVTDDSISMVSEAATAGRRAVLLRTERRGRLRAMLQRATAWLAKRGSIDERLVWGVPRFDATLERFKAMGLAIEWQDRMRERLRAEAGEPVDRDAPDFCEAKRAADWILSHIGEVSRPRRDQ